jgi:hypothetical protein
MAEIHGLAAQISLVLAIASLVLLILVFRSFQTGG